MFFHCPLLIAASIIATKCIPSGITGNQKKKPQETIVNKSQTIPRRTEPKYICPIPGIKKDRIAAIRLDFSFTITTLLETFSMNISF